MAELLMMPLPIALTLPLGAAIGILIAKLIGKL